MKDFYNWMEDEQQMQAMLQQAMQNMNQGQAQQQRQPAQQQRQPAQQAPQQGQDINAKKQSLMQVINQQSDPVIKQRLQQQLAQL